MTPPRGYPAQEAATWELLQGRSFTVAELVDELGLSRSRANDILTGLRQHGHVTSEGRPARFTRIPNAPTPIPAPADR